MTREEFIQAMDDGLAVRWSNDGYHCYKSNYGEYLVTFEPNGHTIGIFHKDGIGMNIFLDDCYIKEETMQ